MCLFSPSGCPDVDFSNEDDADKHSLWTQPVKACPCNPAGMSVLHLPQLALNHTLVSQQKATVPTLSALGNDIFGQTLVAHLAATSQISSAEDVLLRFPEVSWTGVGVQFVKPSSKSSRERHGTTCTASVWR